MSLEEYRRKRRFAQTPEPAGEAVAGGKGVLRFTVQKHHATRLHYDLRLEIGGVLKSWAVPKGPTQDPAEKRLAMMVEDHPLEYLLFEGIIPADNYGAGTVMVWDTGTYEALLDPNPEVGLAKGDLKFRLEGKKLKGEFALVRMRSRRPGSKGNEWLLLKKKDAHARPGWDAEVFDWSVITKRSLEQIAADEGSATWSSSKKVVSKKFRLRGKGRPGPESEPELGRRKAEAARRTIEMARRQAAGKAAGRTDPASLPGAVQARMPRAVRPMLATLVEEPPKSSDWLFEIKWDGVRVLAFVEDGSVRLQSRALRDITPHYPELAGLAGSLRARQAVLDGEIVCLDAEGRSSFERLQQRMNTVPDERLLREYPALYYLYDLIYLDGYDLRRVPLAQRKETLRKLLLPAAEDQCVFFSDHQAGEGMALWEAAREKRLEGIIAKHRDSAYIESRSPEWLKIKVAQEREFIVGGYTEPRRSRSYFGSLILGEYRDGQLIHMGNAGSGFTRDSQKEAWEKLKPLRAAQNPFQGRPATLEKPYWVRPELTARVRFTELTKDGKMRAPVVLEVRRASSPGRGRRDASRPEAPALPPAGAGLFSGPADTQVIDLEGRRVKIQNLGKLFFPGDGYTKRDVMEYYDQIRDYLLPHMQDRPVSMKRYPNGIDQPYFFQKEAGSAMPGWVRTEKIESDHGGSDFINYVICNDRPTLVYLANLGCIEQNLWMSRIGSLDSPDFVLFDLDPGSDVTFAMVIQVARAVRASLERLELTGYPKTSGARGMHVCVPLAPGYTYDHSRDFAQLVCMLVAQEAPRLVTQERSLKRRPQNRIYLDFVQNAKSKTVPPPYSLRARPGGPVSTPLLWSEVKAGLDPQRFNLRTIWRRLEKHGDLFAGVLQKGQRLELALQRLQEQQNIGR